MSWKSRALPIDEIETAESTTSNWRERAQPIEPIQTEKTKQYPAQDTIKQLPRQAAEKSLRMIETGIGLPRALGEFGEMLIPEKALKYGAEKIGLKEPVEKGLELAKKYAPYKLFPTSEKVREFGKNLWGEHFEPKNKAEEISDEIASDFAALAMPLPGAQFKPIRSLLTSIGANLAGEGAEFAGLGPKTKAYTKLGIYGIESLINPKGVEKFKNQLYDKARKARTEDATVSTHYLKDNLSKIKEDLKKGGEEIGQSSQPAIKIIDSFEPRMQGAQVPIEELERAKIKINEEKAKLWETVKEKKYQKLARRNIERVSKEIDSALDLYGTQNPEYEKAYKAANEVHSAIANSKKVSNYIKKHAKGIASPVLGYFGLEHLVPSVPHILGAKTIPAALGGYGALKTSEFISRLSKSPILRKYYTNVLKGAMKEKASVVAENLRKLQAELGKEKEEE